MESQHNNLHSQLEALAVPSEYWPDIQLLPGEAVVAVECPPITELYQKPSALKAIEQLTGAASTAKIGEFGPSVASRATEQNQGLEALRLFEVLFGRDSLIVASFLHAHYPKLAQTTLLELATLQGVGYNPNSEEEPGRIIHESRDLKTDTIAQRLTAERQWEWPYYGSIDATLLYAGMLASVAQTPVGASIMAETFKDRAGNTVTMEDSFERAIEWILRRMAQNPEGLVEYRRSNPKGHPNQVWKDSEDSYFHASGQFANHNQGIASIEVQALAYDALAGAAQYFKTQDPGRAEIAARAAESLKMSIMSIFWVEDERGGYFALGTDRDEQSNVRPMQIRSSNMGHVLNSSVLEGDDSESILRKESVIKTLFSSEMLAAAGIRTLSSKEVRYRPGAYHNGSVWPWDSFYIAKGLDRHGYHGLAFELKNRMWQVVHKTNKFPELVRGEQDEIRLNKLIITVKDQTNLVHRIEQPPQELQAWTVAAMLAAKHEYPHTPREATDPAKRLFELELLGRIEQLAPKS